MKFFRSVRFKVWLCAGVAFVGFVVATASTYVSNVELTDDLSLLRKNAIPLALTSNEVVNTFKKQTKFFEDAFLLGDMESIQSGEDLAVEVSDLLQQIEPAVVSVGAMGADDFQRLQDSYQGYSQLASKYYGMLANGEDFVEIQAEVQAVGQQQGRLMEDLEGLTRTAEKLVEEHVEAVRQIADNNMRRVLVLLCGVFFVSVVLVEVFARKLLIQPLRRLQSNVRLLADGRLDQIEVLEVNAQDEIGELAKAMNEMVAQVTSVVQKTSLSSDNLTRISNAINGVSGQITSSAQIQVEEVEKTSGVVAEIKLSVDGVGSQVDNLNHSASDVTSSILEMAASTEELALNAESLAANVDEVSSSISEMATSMKQVVNGVDHLQETSATTLESVSEMDASIHQVQQNAQGATSRADGVQKDAANGQEAVEATIEGIEQITEASRVAYEAIQNLSTKAQDIGDILKVIDEVTEQTNLLALNAAIIAAQAGDRGRGFAVVADEIRDLANRTGESTNAIAEVVHGVQQETNRAVQAIELTEQSVAEGKNLSVRSGHALKKIVDGVQDMARQMEQISAATMNQTRESQMIGEAMQGVAEMVEQIQDATSEQSKASDQILQATERMRDMTEHVKRSTREQSNAGQSISGASENISEMIVRIQRACEEQVVGTQRIVSSMQGIEQSTGVNLTSTGTLDDNVKGLAQQAKTLQEAIQHFQFETVE